MINFEQMPNWKKELIALLVGILFSVALVVGVYYINNGDEKETTQSRIKNYQNLLNEQTLDFEAAKFNLEQKILQDSISNSLRDAAFRRYKLNGEKLNGVIQYQTITRLDTQKILVIDTVFIDSTGGFYFNKVEKGLYEIRGLYKEKTKEIEIHPIIYDTYTIVLTEYKQATRVRLSNSNPYVKIDSASAVFDLPKKKQPTKGLLWFGVGAAAGTVATLFIK